MIAAARTLFLLALVSSCMQLSAEPVQAAAEQSASLGELSALVALSGGRFLTVDDERGVLLLESAQATTGKLIVPLGDLEGLCTAPDGRFLAVAEASGVVTAFTLEGKTETLGTLAHPPVNDEKKAKANKGWEGIVFLSAEHAFDKKPHLVAVHEGAPKAIGIFAWPSLAPEHTLTLSGDHDGKLADLSDVGVDPKTGALLLVSDESARIVHAKLVAAADDPDGKRAPTLAAGRVTELPMAKDQKAEGVAVDDKGALWIVTDKTGKLVSVGPPP